MVVPDEPEKSILNLPWCISARGNGSMNSSSSSTNSSSSSSRISEPLVKSLLLGCDSDSDESENTKKNVENFLESIEIIKQQPQPQPQSPKNQSQFVARHTERYFTPALVHCFDESQNDKQSRLYRQYFQKMFMNYAAPPQLP